MSRLIRLAAAAAALVLLGGTACKKNSAPEQPYIQGPTSARPGSAQTYNFSSTDPDGDSVFFKVRWGDGDTTGWSPATASGEEYTLTHTYADSGTYYMTAAAKDLKDVESAWSDSFRVRVASFGPDAPSKPTGPTACSTGIAYTFRTRAVHPLHDSVSIKFFWGSGPADTSAWGPMIASNEYYEAIHTYSLPGQYKIAAQARDGIGLESPWSESLLVTVDTAIGTPPGAPRNLVLAADAPSDSTVRITWTAPTDSVPLRYILFFKETGTSNYNVVDSTTGLTIVHNPFHHTGSYKVAAAYATGRVMSSEAPTTIPHWNSLQWIPELSAGDSGYYWDRVTGSASIFSMDSLFDVDSVDFYVTDFASGFSGLNWYAASPDTAPSDPGGSVPSGNWHHTTFTHLDSLADEDSILPYYVDTRYLRKSLMDSLPRLVACRTWDKHFALLRIADIDTVSGAAQIESWFQLIPNLRLIEHF